jgi:starch synthase
VRPGKKHLVFWFVCREYAEIAEAGGVKNIVCSLCEGLAARGHAVTAFIPRYSFSNLSLIEGLAPAGLSTEVQAGDTVFPVSFSSGLFRGVRMVFAESPVFEHRRSVYTYTAGDEEENPSHVRGQGFTDAQAVNVVFQKAVIAYTDLLRLSPEARAPDIVHCHDATTALTPVFAAETPGVREFFASTAFAVSIHNAGPSYHHEFFSLDEARTMTALPEEVLAQGMNGRRVEPYLLAASRARLLTVSPWYAEELLGCGPDHSDGLAGAFAARGISITGITNGIDPAKYDTRKPRASLLPAAYDPAAGRFAGKETCRDLFFAQCALREGKQPIREFLSGGAVDVFGFLEGPPGTVLFGYHGRLAQQKGIGVLAGAAESLLSQGLPVAFALCGQGEGGLEDRLIALAEGFPGRVVFFRGYDRFISRYCTAASDFFVLPSDFEPCGLEDLIAQLFGAIPVAHATGGLKKIIHQKTGFLYEKNDPQTLGALLRDLAEDFLRDKTKYRAIAREAAGYVKKHYSWDRVLADSYLPLYHAEARQCSATT